MAANTISIRNTMKEEPKQEPVKELTQEQKDARWKLMKEIATLNNTGKHDELMILLDENLDAIDSHVLSMVSNVVTLTKEFVTKHHAVLTKIMALDIELTDFRDAFRFELLKGLLEETNPVETH